MTAASRGDRLRAMIAQASSELARTYAPVTGPPAPGHVYAFPTDAEIAIEWLVVRAHPDDPRATLLVALDDGPLEGPPDVALDGLVGRPLTARCGQALWARTDLLPESRRVGLVPEEALLLIRRRIAELVRGRLNPSEVQLRVSCDPEYDHWLSFVEHARVQVGESLSRPDPVFSLRDLSDALPAELPAELQFALSAGPGGELMGDLEAAAQTAARYLTLDRPEGKLIFRTDPSGVVAIWAGPTPAPVLETRSATGAQAVAWLRSPSGGYHRTAVVLAWVADQVVVSVGSPHPQTLTFTR